MFLNLLAAGFALLMLARHGRRAMPLLSPGAPADARRRAMPSFLAVAAALLLLAASLFLLVRGQPRTEPSAPPLRAAASAVHPAPGARP